MRYAGFASLYDYLMSEAPYDQWVEYVRKNVPNQQLDGLTLLDVGCGTGELMLELLKQNVEVTGLDLSADMLTVARTKAGEQGFNPLLIEADMTELAPLAVYDLVTVFCDSLNYLATEDEVKLAFEGFAKQLSPGGLLLFDVHSQHKINHEFIGHTFADADEDVSYIWTSFAGEYPDSVEHELTFFSIKDSGEYERFDEVHAQRTFSINQYKQWLLEAGFRVESVTADFSPNPPSEKSERIFFKAIKL
ncbi:class I SAM-dependent DNA methyltransferase [Alkalicoccobacillus murimartini]|uniref:SAM-dependent methyltransferase n=1 Tax=Alkalicoccobacillus murimartini TaxID=171685 RepID=A0ABT9YCQ6_9BACI|nr:class I SAM-dependent methyltransferase [Alkalicoccobacillus murimartini]MDQ0205511.1 SAM-dependent methyltransferase [Alkalicoccobacillus murimartini]